MTYSSLDLPDVAVSPPDGASAMEGLQYSPYRHFTRDEWARLRADTPMTLVPRDLDALSGLIEELSMEEVEQIYLPLSRLLNLYVAASQDLHAVTSRFLGRKDGRAPFISLGVIIGLPENRAGRFNLGKRP